MIERENDSFICIILIFFHKFLTAFFKILFAESMFTQMSTAKYSVIMISKTLVLKPCLSMWGYTNYKKVITGSASREANDFIVLENKNKLVRFYFITDLTDNFIIKPLINHLF